MNILCELQLAVKPGAKSLGASPDRAHSERAAISREIATLLGQAMKRQCELDLSGTPPDVFHLTQVNGWQ